VVRAPIALQVLRRDRVEGLGGGGQAELGQLAQ